MDEECMTLCASSGINPEAICSGSRQGRMRFPRCEDAWAPHSVAVEAERFWLRKSVTIHAAPVIARFCALPAQLIILCGSAKGAGSHTSKPKPISMAVSNRDAIRAERRESSATAASANAIVVVIAQNICPGGIHLGTNAAVPER